MKKGQVTVFIIIGIVILLAAAIILYIRWQVTDPGSPIPFFQDPVEKYVQQCLSDTAEEALIILGQQGGYLEIPEESKLASEFPGSPILKTQNQYMPYWFYQDSRGIDTSQMPRLEKEYEEDYSIQWQLEDYVKRKVNECIDWSVFEARGTQIIEKGTMGMDVIITEANVNFRLTYPIEANTGSKSTTYTQFYTEVPVRLGRVYRLAKEVRDHELNTLFLERNAMNLITIHSRIDDDYLPPMYGGLQFESCEDRVMWLFPDVEEDFSDMLQSNIPYLKVAGTGSDFIEITDEPDDDKRAIRQGIFANMVQEVSDNYYPFIEVDFSTSPGDLELDLGSQGVLQPLSYEMDLFFASVCMFEYQFAYNLKYPVIITITDTKSKANNREYIFSYPMQTVLKDNHPRIKYGLYNPDEETEFASSECTPSQRLSEEFTFNVVDSDNNGIDARIYYQCGPSTVYEYHANGSIKSVTPFAEKCYIDTADQGFLKTRLPQCSGDTMIIAESSGYLTQIANIGSTIAEGKATTLKLDKIYELKVNVQKFAVKPPGDSERPGIIADGSSVTACNIYSEAANLQPYESALIRLEKTDTENGEMPYPSIANFMPKNQTTIKIAPGTYSSDILLFRNERFNGEMTIRQNSEQRQIDGGPLGDDETITYPDKDVLLPSVISGGIVDEYTFTEAELENADTITFYIVDESAPKIIEEIGTPINHREGCARLNPELLAPKLS